MSRGLNKLQIIGRLGRDPEARYTAEGKMVVNFSVATGGRWTDRDGNERDDTEWFRVEAWDRLAETCNNYLHKGDQVYIEGRLKSRKYTDKEGVERTSVDVVANNMLILTPKGGGSAGNSYDNNDAEDEAPAAPVRSAPSRAPEPRAAAPSRQPAPTRAAPSRAPAGRNQPQPIESEDDIPF
jgi:single-strand DNA-binding protein